MNLHVRNLYGRTHITLLKVRLRQRVVHCAKQSYY